MMPSKRMILARGHHRRSDDAIGQKQRFVLLSGERAVMMKRGAMMNRLHRAVATLAVTLALGVSAVADVPREMTFQGMLTGGTGPANLTIRFYDAETAGNELWPPGEIHSDVPLVNGVFSINIGSQTTGGIPNDALDYKRLDPNAEAIWLGISVNGGPELTPRTQVVMAPYSAKSASSEKLVAPGTLRDVLIIDQRDGHDCAKLVGPEGNTVVWLRARAEGHGLISFNEVDGDYVGAIGVASGGGGSMQLKAPDGTHNTFAVFPIGNGVYLRLSSQGGTEIDLDGRHQVGDGSGPAARLTLERGGTALNTYTAEFKSSESVRMAGGILFSQGSTYGINAYTTGTGGTSGALRFAYVKRDDGSLVSDDVLVVHQGGIRTKVLQITGADLAERFSVSDEVQPGSVVEIDPANPGKLRLARDPYSPLVAGVVSGAGDLAAGAVLGDVEGSEDMPPIALSGRVWVKCDASHAPIAPGNLLTTSTTPGHAMRASDERDVPRGCIIGKAMTKLDEGNGLVLLLVQPQ